MEEGEREEVREGGRGREGKRREGGCTCVRRGPMAIQGNLTWSDFSVSHARLYLDQ